MPGPLSARGRITSRGNPLVREARELLTARGRREHGLFLVEGLKLIADALSARFVPHRAFVASTQLEARPGGASLLAVLDPATTVETTPDLLASLADTETTQGIVALFPIPPAAVPTDLGQVLLVLDGIQDPGNVGTILRSAVGSGLVTTVVSRGGADPYGPKVVRAGAGAQFHLSFLPDLPPTPDRPVWLADIVGESYQIVDWRKPSVLVIGSEGAGASLELRDRATGRVSIPLPGPVESLNAAIAASIILFEAARQVAAETE